VPCIDHLFNMDYNGNIKYVLATSSKVADDGKSVTYTLRQGVTFQDGTSFDATAEKWNLDKWMGAHQPGTENWVSVDVVDPYTIRINLTEYRNTVFSSLAADYCAPISPTAYEKNGNAWAEKNPVGTGPFKLVSMDPDVGWRYERNANYWGSKPYLDAIEYKVVPDLNVAQMMLEKGDAEMVLLTGTAGTNLKLALQKIGWQVIVPPSGGDVTCLMPDGNNPDSPWAKQEVRLAADYALNKQEIAALGKGYWDPTWQLANPKLNFYDPSLTRPYDPDKAKQLMNQAGYPTGLDTTLYFDPSTPTDFAVAVQSNLKDAGIRCDLQTVAINSAFEMIMKGWHNGCFGIPFGLSINFMQGIQRYFSSTQRLMFVSILGTAELQGYIDNGLKATTTQEQNKFNALAVKYILDNEIVVPVYRINSVGIMAPYVHDPGYKGTVLWTPETCWLSK
jgi:ABC-type transport system substrate-binding protein